MRDQAIVAMDALVAAGFSVTVSAAPTFDGTAYSYGVEATPSAHVNSLRDMLEVAERLNLDCALPMGTKGRLWPKDDLS